MKFRSRQSEPGSNGLMLRPLCRRGVVFLEFILAFPLLVILLLAVIEFTLIYQLNQQVASASKFGAKLASEVSRRLADNPRLSNFNIPGGPPAGQSLKERIDQYLATQQLTASCSVVLEHTACSISNTTQQNPGSISSSCNCGTPPTPPAVPSEAIPEDVAYVQVTVAVKLANNVPDLLNSFGFKLENRTCIQTTTMRLEPNNTPPDPAINGTQSGGLPTNYSVTAGSFPLSCGENMVIRNDPGDAPSGGVVTINFNGTGSIDAEQASGLQYHWTTTSSGMGASITPSGGSVNSAAVQFQLSLPPDPNSGMGLQGPNVAHYGITLTVTDSCGHSQSCTTNVSIETHDSDPNP